MGGRRIAIILPNLLKRTSLSERPPLLRCTEQDSLQTVDDQVRELLTECWQRYNPTADMWTSTYLCPLRDDAEALNRLALNGLPENDNSVVFYAEYYENDERINNTDRSTIFKKERTSPQW
jgi:hypothetical protein